MSDLQKEFIRNVVIFFLIIFGTIGLLYLCTTIQIVGVIVIISLVGGLVLSLVGCILYFIISELIKDYKIRGVLTKDEYEFYSIYSNPKEFIWMSDNADEEYVRIIKLLEDNNIKL